MIKKYYKDKGGEILEGDLVKTVKYKTDKVYKIEVDSQGSTALVVIIHDTNSKAWARDVQNHVRKTLKT